MVKPRSSPKPWLLNRHREHLRRLENKVSGTPLLSSLDEGRQLNDLFNYKPEELPGVPDKGEERLYFTSPIWVNGMRKRSSKFGRWHARDGKLEIRDLEKREFGFTQHLIYFQGGCPGTRTKWAMKEYTLASSRIPHGVDELALCVIYKTRVYKRNETSCGKNLKAKTLSDDGGPSTSSEPVVQTENPVGELTGPSFKEYWASEEFPLDSTMEWQNDPWFKDSCRGPSNPSSEPVMQAEEQVGELTDFPFPDLFAPVEFPVDPYNMDWENNWYEDCYRDTCSGFDN